MSASFGFAEDNGGLTKYHSKTLSREQQAFSSEKELKVNALRATQDEIGRKSLHIGRLKAQQDKRKMEEEALSDMQNTLGTLHDELRVHFLFSWVLLQCSADKGSRIWTRLFRPRRLLGRKRMKHSADSGQNGRMQRKKLAHKLGCISQV